MKASWELVWDDLPIIFGLVVILSVYSLVAYFIIDWLFPDEDDSFNNGRVSGACCKHHGMSPKEVSELPRFNYCQGGSCAICLDGIRSGEMCRAFPTCRHVYHARCIDPWLVKRGNCPVCRAPFEREGGVTIRIIVTM
ncbi:hypothetical protein MLD38_012917 [Melastoma candidum]|uniref:Uncharacterized protein n=1 Tax=Melastoma candidum TaxID=119954 RepID=A0ACB9RGC2_9MYRT|nr:hypothetical protein MLD38_012917 [Melastoma candidum]